jgi:hypothetical protein
MLNLPLAKGEPSPREKVRQVMLRFKDGLLRTPSVQRPDGSTREGAVVTNRKQAIAIALSQAGLRKAAPEDNDMQKLGWLWVAPKEFAGVGKRHIARLAQRKNFEAGRLPNHRAAKLEEIPIEHRKWAAEKDELGPKATRKPLSYEEGNEELRNSHGEWMGKCAPHERHNCADERVAGMMPHADRVLRVAGKKHAAGATEPDVISMVPDMRRLLGTVTVPTPRSRMQNNASIGDHRTSLSHLVR